MPIETFYNYLKGGMILKTYKIAIIGATGLVGRSVIQVLEEKKLPIETFRIICF